jgi:hypothetical protein
MSATNLSTSNITERVAFRNIPLAAGIAALIGVVGNSIVWFIGNAINRMAFELPFVITMSVLGVVIGAILFAILGKFAKRPIRLFTIISVVFLLLYAILPISATAQQTGSPMPPFNIATVIAAEIMHIISGLAAIWSFRKHGRA